MLSINRAAREGVGEATSKCGSSIPKAVCGTVKLCPDEEQQMLRESASKSLDQSRLGSAKRHQYVVSSQDDASMPEMSCGVCSRKSGPAAVRRFDFTDHLARNDAGSFASKQHWLRIHRRVEAWRGMSCASQQNLRRLEPADSAAKTDPAPPGFLPEGAGCDWIIREQFPAPLWNRIRRCTSARTASAVPCPSFV